MAPICAQCVAGVWPARPGLWPVIVAVVWPARRGVWAGLCGLRPVCLGLSKQAGVEPGLWPVTPGLEPFLWLVKLGAESGLWSVIELGLWRLQPGLWPVTNPGMEQETGLGGAICRCQWSHPSPNPGLEPGLDPA